MRNSTADKLVGHLKNAVIAYGLSMTTALSGEAVLSGFSDPVAFAVEHDGSFYVSNWGTGTIERVDIDGTRSTVLKDFPAPAGLAIDRSGALYAASYQDDVVVRLDLRGNRTVVASGLSTPTGMVFARDGRLLVADRSSGSVLAVDVGSGLSTVIAEGLSLPVGVVEMEDGSIVVSQYGGRVTRFLADGERQELGQAFVRPGVGILADGSDAVLVVDNGAAVVRRVDFRGRSEVLVRGLAGSPVALGQARDGDLLVGTWGEGLIYQVPKPNRSVGGQSPDP